MGDVVPLLRRCDCCGERKRDVRPDGAGACQCVDCLAAGEREARRIEADLYTVYQDPDDG